MGIISPSLFKAGVYYEEYYEFHMNRTLPMIVPAYLRIPAAILVLCGLFAYSIVLADTASTSVTVGNSAPVTSAASFNGGTNITLTENTLVNATGTVTVTDANGCSTITGVSAKFFLAATANSGSACTYDGNSCYTSTCVATTTGNQCTGGGDTSVQYDCGFAIWYNATPTDAGASASSIWTFAATSTDGTASHVATNTAQTIEVNTLNALNVTASVAYGSVGANSDTGSTNQTTTITVTGNNALDTQLSGDVMCTNYPTCSGGVLQPSQQEYSLNAFTYGAGTDLAATTSPATVETVLAKPTATTSPVTDDVLWGIGIPNGQTTGSYTGQNTFTAVSD